MGKITPVKIDDNLWKKIAYSPSQASSGDFIDEDNILKQYWGDTTDGVLGLEQLDDGTYLITEDGVPMGYTDKATGDAMIQQMKENEQITKDLGSDAAHDEHVAELRHNKETVSNNSVNSSSANAETKGTITGISGGMPIYDDESSGVGKGTITGISGGTPVYSESSSELVSETIEKIKSKIQTGASTSDSIGSLNDALSTATPENNYERVQPTNGLNEALEAARGDFSNVLSNDNTVTNSSGNSTIEANPNGLNAQLSETTGIGFSTNNDSNFL